MKEILRSKTLISLTGISVLNGFVWWLIIDWLMPVLRPHDSWVGNTISNYAIPSVVIIFLTWFNFVVAIPLFKRILFNLLIVLYCAILFYFLRVSFYCNYAGGPAGFMLYLQTPDYILLFYRLLMFFIIPFFPIGIYILLRLFGKKVKPIYLLISFLGFVLSFPLTSLIFHGVFFSYLEIVQSGFFVAVLTFFVGLQVAGIKK